MSKSYLARELYGFSLTILPHGKSSTCGLVDITPLAITTEIVCSLTHITSDVDYTYR